jgi:hypothetical protein
VPNVWFSMVAPATVDAMSASAQHRVTQHRVTQHRDPPHSRARYRDVLGAAEFRAIFAANIVSMLGSVVPPSR